ncbi:Uncharacterised protein [uncultured archaeon]|nr:Uncharacterised protein [uncultured archaeon]
MANDRTQKDIAMVSAVSEVLRLRKEKGAMTAEEMMRDLTGFLRYTRDQNLKVLMVAAASRALNLITQNPGVSDKEVMNQMVRDLEVITAEVEADMQ